MIIQKLVKYYQLNKGLYFVSKERYTLTEINLLFMMGENDNIIFLWLTVNNFQKFVALDKSRLNPQVGKISFCFLQHLYKFCHSHVL